MSETTPLRIADFGPYTQSNQAPGDPTGFTAPPLSQMEQQVDFIADNNFANTVRLYTDTDQQGAPLIDYSIQQDGLNVIPSVFLDNPTGPDGDTSSPIATWSQIMGDTTIMSELNNFVTALESLPAGDFSKIPFIDIGNEEISEVGGWSDTDVEDAIEYVKGQLDQTLPSNVASQLKFTTAETYDGQYINVQGDVSYNQTNAQNYTATFMGDNSDIDVIFVNVNAFLDGVAVPNAAAYVDTIYKKLLALYPDKQIVISETGWPSAPSTDTRSNFYTNQTAVPSVANEQNFWDNFIGIANQQDISFGAFEAYDEPNKDRSNPPDNLVFENHWGLISANSGPAYSTSSFKTSVTSLMPSITRDFNGDGMSDVLWQNDDAQDNGTGQVAVWLMSGTAPTATAIAASPAPAWHAVATGDFYDFGKAGILWQYENAQNLSDPANGEVAIWEMNGATPIAETIVANPPANWHAVTTGDFDGDLHADILWQYENGQNASDPQNGETAIWLMNGATPTAEQVIANPGPSWHAIATGDFDGDGKADILWQYENGQNASDPQNGEAAIWLMNGTTPTAQQVVANPGADWHVIATGDFDGDGKSDILWQYENAQNASDPANGEAAIWLMNGTTPTQEAVIGFPPSSWHAVGTGDFDGDGKADIVWQNTNGQAAIWEMNGVTPTAELIFASPPSTWHIVGGQ